MRIRTSIALGVVGAWLLAAPVSPASAGQSPSQAGAATVDAQGVLPEGRPSAVIKALRTPGAAPLSQASAAPASQGVQQAAPAPILPPEGSPPLLRTIRIEFPTQGNASVIDPQTYFYYIQTRPSRPSDGVWVPWDEAAEKSVLEDFKRLWGTNFLDNLWIEVREAPYHQRRDGQGSLVQHGGAAARRNRRLYGLQEIEQSKMEKLREESVTIRLDSFIDPALISVEGIIRGMFAEKGYEFASVSHTISEVAGGPKLVNLTFKPRRGPKSRCATSTSSATRRPPTASSSAR